jgi:membrane carboxypeptidase/penicillin-binding protein
MTTAYATIANGGRKVVPTTISKVVSDAVGKDEIPYEAPHEP